MKPGTIIVIKIIGLMLLIAAIAFNSVEAADSGFEFPTAAVNDATVGTLDWGFGSAGSLIAAIEDNDDDQNVMANCGGCRASGATSENALRLFIGGVPVGNDLDTGATISTGLRTYGGATELAGLTPTPSEINASDFGFGVSWTGNGGTSKYLYSSGYGFAIPVDATIDGIEITLDLSNPSGTARIDYVQMKVYYTEAADTLPGKASVQTGTIRINGAGKIIF